MVRPLKFGNRLAISFHALKLIDCLSVLALKLIRVNNRGSWRQYEDHDIQDTISRRWLPKMGGSYHGLRGNHHGWLLSYLHHVCWTLQERVQPHSRGWLVKQAQAWYTGGGVFYVWCVFLVSFLWTSYTYTNLNLNLNLWHVFYPKRLGMGS